MDEGSIPLPIPVNQQKRHVMNAQCLASASRYVNQFVNVFKLLIAQCAPTPRHQPPHHPSILRHESTFIAERGEADDKTIGPTSIAELKFNSIRLKLRT